VKQVFKTTLLLGLLTGLFLGVGYMIGGRSGAIIALLIATVMNFGMFWFSGKLVLKMQKAVPLDAQKYGYIDTEILNENELRSVLAHELGHVKNRDMLVSTVAATVGGAIAILAEMAFWGGALFGGGNEEGGNNWVGSIAMMILAPFAAVLIQMAVSRSREFLADQHGKSLIGHGNDLASALQKLEDFKPRMSNLKPTTRQDASSHLMFMNMFNAKGLAGLFATHPSTANRVARLTGTK